MRSSAVVAVGTALSRLTGFVRIAAIAYALGVTALAGTYSYANETPNIVYELLLGGVFTATLVPLFVKHFEIRRRGRGQRPSSPSRCWCSLAVTVVGVLLRAVDRAPLHTRRRTDAAAPTSRSSRPSCCGCSCRRCSSTASSTLATAMLNAQRRFVAAAFAPILNNVVVIAVFLMLPRIASGSLSVHCVLDDDALVLLMGVGTTAGVAVMALALLPALRHAPTSTCGSFPRGATPPSSRCCASVGWTVGYVIANQIALFVVTVLAVGTKGGPFVYMAAYAFFQLPARPVRGVADDHVLTRARAASRRAATSRDARAAVARVAAHDRRSIVPAAALYIGLARPIDRHAPRNAARSPRGDAVDGRRHARRVRGRARAVLALPLRVARVHVTPRHLHAVLDQLHRERDQHRVWRSASTPGSASPGSRSRSRSRTSVARGARPRRGRPPALTASTAARSRPPS